MGVSWGSAVAAAPDSSFQVSRGESGEMLAAACFVRAFHVFNSVHMSEMRVK